MSDILLVESPSKRQVPPLGLMKLSTFHKSQRHNVRFIRGYDWGEVKHYDAIEIASPDFTWEISDAISCVLFYKNQYPGARLRVGGTTASDNPEVFASKTGIAPTCGVLPEVDLCAPDYSLFPEINYSLVNTTRGCAMQCPFCRIGSGVKKGGQEGSVVYSIPTWKSHVDPNKRRLIIQDNNIFGAKKEHFHDVLQFIKERKLPVDFNSGFEVHQARESVFEEMAEVRVRPVRTAFDELREEREAERTVHWIKEYLKPPSHSIMVYVLFNFYEKTARECDTPETALYRCNKILEWGAVPYVMPYYPLKGWYKRDYCVSPNWTRDQVAKFRRFFDRHWIVFSVWKKKGKIELADIFNYNNKTNDNPSTHLLSTLVNN